MDAIPGYIPVVEEEAQPGDTVQEVCACVLLCRYGAVALVRRYCPLKAEVSACLRIADSCISHRRGYGAFLQDSRAEVECCGRDNGSGTYSSV